MSGIMMLLLAGAKKAADSFFNYVTLLLPGNGTNGAQNNTFVDSSTNAFTITRNGNTTQGTFSPFSQTGWSNYFDGTGDYLTWSGTTLSADFTVECWVYKTAVDASGYTNVFSGSGNQQFSIDLTTANSIGLIISGSTVISPSGTAVTPNMWHHLAWVREGSTCRAYVDGIEQGTGSSSTSFTLSVIGRYVVSGYEMNGYISNARIIAGTCLYPSGTTFTPPTVPLTAITNTSLLTCQSNRFIDNSSNAFAITRNGDVSVQAFSPFNPTAAWSASTNGGSGYFDGTGDYLSLASNSAFAFGTGAYTIEAWVYLPAYAANQGAIFDAGSAAGSLNFFITNAGGIGIGIYGTGNIFASSAGAVPLNSWNHVVVVRSSTASNDTKIYVNGVLSATGTDSNNWTVTTSPRVGGINLAGYNTIGYLSDVRVVKGSAVYTAAFTPPTAPLTAISGTSLLTNFTNAGIYDATAKNDLETVGNAQISTTQSQWGGSSMYFDGTGDVLSIPDTQNLKFGTGDFTVEAWVYLTGTPSAQYAQIVGRTEYGTNADWMLQITNSRTLTWFMQNSFVATSTGAISLNTWTHVAATRSGSSIRLFINGAVDGTATNANSTEFNSSGVYTVGADQAGNEVNLTGYIQDLRITKGVARYTTAFTPPTAAFPLT